MYIVLRVERERESLLYEGLYYKRIDKRIYRQNSKDKKTILSLGYIHKIYINVLNLNVALGSTELISCHISNFIPVPPREA